MPKDAVSKDIFTGLRDTLVFLIPGDPGCVLKWDPDLCKVLEHVRARVNPEDLSGNSYRTLGETPGTGGQLSPPHQ